MARALLAVAVLTVFLIVVEGRQAYAAEGTAPPVANANGVALSPASEPKRCLEGQVFIPGVTFLMGSKDAIPKDEKPVHKVTLSPFCIDKTEVTVAAFRECVEKGACEVPTPLINEFGITEEKAKRLSGACTWGKVGFKKHPMNCVDHNQAMVFCDWRGGRLPTEAEWELAAKGTDSHKYPWGNERPDKTRLNGCDAGCAKVISNRYGFKYIPLFDVDDGWPMTAPVGSFVAGATSNGLMDMAGNVAEWTADEYRPYKSSPVKDPLIKLRVGSDAKSVRGGGWSDGNIWSDFWATKRGRVYFQNRWDWVGFRCVRTPKK